MSAANRYRVAGFIFCLIAALILGRYDVRSMVSLWFGTMGGMLLAFSEELSKIPATLEINDDVEVTR